MMIETDRVEGSYIGGFREVKEKERVKVSNLVRFDEINLFVLPLINQVVIHFILVMLLIKSGLFESINRLNC